MDDEQKHDNLYVGICMRHTVGSKTFSVCQLCRCSYLLGYHNAVSTLRGIQAHNSLICTDIGCLVLGFDTICVAPY